MYPLAQSIPFARCHRLFHDESCRARMSPKDNSSETWFVAYRENIRISYRAGIKQLAWPSLAPNVSLRNAMAGRSRTTVGLMEIVHQLFERIVRRPGGNSQESPGTLEPM